MSATAELLDRVREAANIKSDNVLSQRLGITRAVISGWRKELYPVPDERIAQLCEMAKLDGPVWMARIHAERATSPVERKVWRSVLDRLSAAAAVLMLVVVAAPSVARANPVQIQGLSDSGDGSMYIMLQRSLPRRTPSSPVLAACYPPSSNPPNAPRTRLHGANLLPQHAGPPV